MATATRELTVFKGHNLRTAISEDGEPGVLQADVCKVIGIKKSRNLTNRLDAKDAFSKGALTPGGIQDMPYLTETGLYKALAGSRKPLARELTAVLVQDMATMRKKGVDSTDTLAPQSDHWAVIKAVAAGMIDMQADLKEVKGEIAILKANNEIKAIANPVPEVSTRLKISQVIRRFVARQSNGYSHQDAFDKLYYEYKYRYHVDLKERAKYAKATSIMDYAEYTDVKEGTHYVDELYGLAQLLFPEN